MEYKRIPYGNGPGISSVTVVRTLVLMIPATTFSLDIKDQEPDMLTIFPNPASGFININSMSVIPDATIEITDLHGRIIYTENHKTYRQKR